MILSISACKPATETKAKVPATAMEPEMSRPESGMAPANGAMASRHDKMAPANGAMTPVEDKMAHKY